MADQFEREPLLPDNHFTAIRHSYSSNGSINRDGPSTTDSSSTNNLAEVFVYKRRWYILLLFSLINLLQNLVWNTFPPITFSANAAFNWSDSMISMLSLWGNLTYVLTGFFFSWIMDFKGLRWASVVTIILVTSGAALRCISSEPVPATWLMNIGQILNGLAGPVAMAGAPLVSAIWFPANERVTSTSICSLAGSIGLAGSFIIGPLMVKDRNITNAGYNTSYESGGMSKHDSDVLATREDIMRLMYVELGACAVVLLAVLIWFPAKPLKPPSISANTTRLSFKSGFKQILRNSRFWIVAISYALSVGITNIWASLINFYEAGVLSQIESGWLGFIGGLASGVAGCIFARFTDMYPRHMKACSLTIFIISFVAALLFTLDGMKVMYLSKVLIYVTYIIVCTGIEGSSPLFYELGCETAYPVAEGLANGLLTWLNNVVGLVFLIALLLPPSIIGLDYNWMNWTMLASLLVTIPLLFFYKEGYNRLDIDLGTQPVVDPEEDHISPSGTEPSLYADSPLLHSNRSYTVANHSSS